MAVDAKQLARVSRRVNAAVGYLELGMTEHALQSVADLGDSGPLRPLVEMVRGQALWMQRRYDEAADVFKHAASTFPAPHDRQAWLALSRYYMGTGNTDLAIQNLARARGAKLPLPRRDSRRPSSGSE